MEKMTAGNGAQKRGERDSGGSDKPRQYPEKGLKQFDDHADNPRRVRGSEVFVGGLQRKATEENLREVFSKCGEIVEVRIMRDSTGVSKGYAFVRFASREAAQRAQREKNGTMLQGKKIGVTPSADQDTLFLGNLRKEWGRQELEEMVMDAFQDVESVELAMPPASGEGLYKKKHQNRGFAFVHFATHAVVPPDRQPLLPLIALAARPVVHAAARAFRAATKSEFMLGGKWRPAVDWAENEPDPDPEEMLKVKTAFIGNLPSTVKEDFLRRLFDPYGKIERIAVSRKGNSPVGFVHFVHRSDVEAAIKALNGKSIAGPGRGPSFKLQVSLAKPVDRSRKRSYEDYQNHNAGLVTTVVPSKVSTGALGLYAASAGAYGDYTDYVVSKNHLVEDPYGLSLYSLPAATSNQLHNLFRAGVASGYEAQKEKSGDALGRGRSADYGHLPGPQAAVRDSQLSASSRLSVLDGYNSLAMAHSSPDAEHRGYEAYGNYSLNALAALPSISPGLLGGQPLLSRVAGVLPEAFATLRSNPANLSAIDAAGANLDTNGASRRPFKFDPYTGEPYKFDPFTGEPLQALHSPNLAKMMPCPLALSKRRNAKSIWELTRTLQFEKSKPNL